MMQRFVMLPGLVCVDANQVDAVRYEGTEDTIVSMVSGAEVRVRLGFADTLEVLFAANHKTMAAMIADLRGEVT